MNTVTQNMLFRQALIKYSQKYGVTKAAIRYKTNRTASCNMNIRSCSVFVSDQTIGYRHGPF